VKRVHTYSALDEVASLDLNTWQDNSGPADIGYGMARVRSITSDLTTITMGPIAFLGPEGDEYTSKSTDTNYVPAGLVTDTFYYLYASVSGSTVTLSHSTTSPEPTLRWQNGDTTKAYICSFRTFTSAGTKIVPFRMENGLYLYRPGTGVATAVGTVANAVASPGAVTGTIDCSSRVPSHVRIARLWASLAGASTPVNLQALMVRGGDSITAGALILGATNTSSASTVQEPYATSVFDFELDDDRTLDASVSKDTSAGQGTLSVRVYGYLEPKP
jgi:hypothetical protein